MLSTVALATKAKMIIAPAMNTNMYDNPATRENIAILKSRGVIFIEPDTGLLACKDVGRGKLASVDDILKVVDYELHKSDELKGKKILITAGATIEDIDPVRYITNKSSGKMGYAIAKTAAQMGAEVTLISGSTHLEVPYNLSNYVCVRSAQDMYEEVQKYWKTSDIVIKAAAVADYTPREKFDNKMKKHDGDLSIPLKRTIDILKSMGEEKTSQILVGFAAETQNLEEYAKNKIIKKNLDMIVANDVSMAGAGFGTDTNIVQIFFRDFSYVKVDKLSKEELARTILRLIKEKIMDKR